MTFLEAHALHGPDVELIAETLGVTPPEADRLINAKMDREYFGPPKLRDEALKNPKPRPKIPFAGYDATEKELVANR